MGNLDNRIANADQLLTQDVERFCNSVVDLYSNLSKVQHPFVQKPILLSQYISRHLLSSSCSSPSSPCWISVYTFSNWQQQSVLRWECTTLCKSTVDQCLWTFWGSFGLFVQGPASMMTYLLISGLFLTRLRRPIGKMTVTEQKYEGEYRYVNSRLITNRWLVLLVSIFVLSFCFSHILMHAQIFVFPSQWRDCLLQWKWKRETDDSFNLQETGKCMTVQICVCLLSKGLCLYLLINYR